MTREDIIRMALEVLLLDARDNQNDDGISQFIGTLSDFAALVAAAERIACAKDASDKIKYRIKQGFAEHGHAEAVKKVILKRGEA